MGALAYSASCDTLACARTRHRPRRGVNAQALHASVGRANRYLPRGEGVMLLGKNGSAGTRSPRLMLKDFGASGGSRAPASRAVQRSACANALRQGGAAHTRAELQYQCTVCRRPREISSPSSAARRERCPIRQHFVAPTEHHGSRGQKRHCTGQLLGACAGAYYLKLPRAQVADDDSVEQWSIRILPGCLSPRNAFLR